MTDFAKEARDARIVEFVTNWKAFIKTPDGVAFYRIVDAARAEGFREGMAKAAEIAREKRADATQTSGSYQRHTTSWNKHKYREEMANEIAEAILAAVTPPLKEP